MAKVRGTKIADVADWSESDIHLAFGLAVRVRRARLGLSQEALGFGAGMHRNYVGYVERGEVNPTLFTMSRLADALGITLAELLAEADARLADHETLDRRREKQQRRRKLSRVAGHAVAEQERKRRGGPAWGSL
ncbi:helix-turn-helix transcriptional regulator [Conexibacter sp. JD483]|uniref:helix-turn-helix domain-containing protein n=1 Tax=unclassified Conexibacter TaxID=2627773 RepID=UPI002725B8F7|nr:MULTISPECIES: helix-turn-helix transcriptional regulator [unclassified Conexibacter]MDO8186475.1 helix-turn-helix transcriptional regulator [Conexibacter sp. CPCC 205706]MDO8200044.1 helix-turn-helix transcriptional regulator [Conexibacter sp. CPCC 205762]MDR9370880.1 helix-turn-helix transcriptional regulator [Conexibacter sp. JD483]